MEEKFEIITLDNGVRLITERVPAVRSAAIGIWVGTGSRDEKANESGAAHFIEHMVFKRTQQHSAAELAEEMDAIGGQVNAYTTKECTCFYARCLDEHLPRATDLLCEMVFSPAFDEEDVATERGVILEEIGMYEDTPEDLCSERLSAAVFAGTALARPILGKKSTLAKMTGAWLRAYQAAHYCAGDIVVALAGSFTEADVEDLKARFLSIPAGKMEAPTPAHYAPAITLKKKAIEQNHLTLAFPSLPYDDPQRFVLQVLSTILGSGMSSRLFQQVREKQGLCYSIYTYGAGHTDTGIFAIYTALGSETEARALSTICRVVRDFAENGPTQQEVDRARELSKASVLMGLESTQARMSSLGRGVLVQGAPLTTEEVLAAYAAVTPKLVQQLAQQMFDFKNVSLSAVGHVQTQEEYRKLLEA